MTKPVFSIVISAILILGCAHKEPASKPVSPRFNHVFLNTNDLEKSVAFYTSAFDVIVFNDIKKLTRTDSVGNSSTTEVHIVLLRFNGQDFNLEIGENSFFQAENTRASYAHIGIDVPDIELASQRLIKAGAQAIRPITLVEASEIKAKTAFFSGPNGETLELMELIEGEF